MLEKSKREERILKEAKYIVETKSTIREVAKKFNVSKSTVHTDLTHRIRYVSLIEYYKVKAILAYNASQRSIRGGEATRKKYKK